MGGQVGDLGSLEKDSPGIHPVITRQEVEKGALPRAVGADDRGLVPRGEMELQVLDRLEPPKTLVEAGHLQNLRGHYAPPDDLRP